MRTLLAATATLLLLAGSALAQTQDPPGTPSGPSGPGQKGQPGPDGNSGPNIDVPPQLPLGFVVAADDSPTDDNQGGGNDPPKGSGNDPSGNANPGKSGPGNS